MGGVYTAKPPADTSPDIPPGWPPSWPFPGAFPPGYEPNLILDPEITEEYPPGGTAEGQKITLKDRQAEDWRTAEPVGDIIALTATMLGDGSTCRLRESGGSFSTTVSKLYTADGSLWAMQADLEFEVDSNDIGDFIVLRYQSTPLAQEEIDATSNILVVSDWTWTARLTYTVSDITFVLSGSYGGSTVFQRKGTQYTWPYCWMFNAQNAGNPDHWNNDSALVDSEGNYNPQTGPWEFGIRMQNLTEGSHGHDDHPWILDLIQDDGVMITEVFDLGTDHNWYVGYNRGVTDSGVPSGPNVTYTIVLKLYKGGRLQTTNTFQETKSDGAAASAGYPAIIFKWEIDKTTKQVTAL